MPSNGPKKSPKPTEKRTKLKKSSDILRIVSPLSIIPIYEISTAESKIIFLFIADILSIEFIETLRP